MKSIVASIVVAGIVAAVVVGVGGAARTSTVVTVTAGKPAEFGYVLSTKTVKHGSVTFKIKNSGKLPHTFKVCSSSKGGTANSCAGKGTAQIKPGASATLTITFAKAGTYEYLCTIAGHAAGGMKGDLKVT